MLYIKHKSGGDFCWKGRGHFVVLASNDRGHKSLIVFLVIVEVFQSMCARAKHVQNRSRSVWDIENNTWAREDMEFQLYISLVLNRVSDVPAADWLSQTREKLS